MKLMWGKIVPGLQNVLLVEDDKDIADMYAQTLTAAGYKVARSADGDNALEQAKMLHPDLVLLDVMIPGHSGLEVLKILRTDPDYGCIKTKIVVVTNLGEADAGKQAWNNDADGFVVKANIVPKDLLDIIHSLE